MIKYIKKIVSEDEYTPKYHQYIKSLRLFYVKDIRLRISFW
jgi:hypothetical protein